MEERYAIVEAVFNESEYSEDEKKSLMLDMYRIESFYASKEEGKTTVVMYSGDHYIVNQEFKDFERLWRPYAGGKIKLFV